MKIAALSTLLLFGYLAPTSAAEPVMDIAKLERMADSADTASDHSQVSKQYRLRAEHFEGKAAEHEEKARQMETRQRSPMEHKWPAMSRQPWVKERQLAMHARRAASESYALADRHMRLSVETLADGQREARGTERARPSSQERARTPEPEDAAQQPGQQSGR